MTNLWKVVRLDNFLFFAKIEAKLTGDAVIAVLG
jgi:hypothetical protein